MKSSFPASILLSIAVIATGIGCGGSSTLVTTGNPEPTPKGDSISDASSDSSLTPPTGGSTGSTSQAPTNSCPIPGGEWCPGGTTCLVGWCSFALPDWCDCQKDASGAYACTPTCGTTPDAAGPTCSSTASSCGAGAEFDPNTCGCVPSASNSTTTSATASGLCNMPNGEQCVLGETCRSGDISADNLSPEWCTCETLASGDLGCNMWAGSDAGVGPLPCGASCPVGYWQDPSTCGCVLGASSGTNPNGATTCYIPSFGDCPVGTTCTVGYCPNGTSPIECFCNSNGTTNCTAQCPADAR